MDGYRTLMRLGILVGLVGVELYLAADLGATTGLTGYTLTRSQTIAPPRAAKVKSISVQLGQHVSAGQLIAELDPTEIDNEIAVAKSLRDKASAALRASAIEVRLEGVDAARKFETTSERANADLATAEATAKTAAAELAAVEQEIANQTDLVAKHLTDGALLKSLELRRAALGQQVATAKNVLAVLHANLAAATRRTSGLDAGSGDPTLLAPLEADLRGAELQVEQLERLRGELSLRAPIDGVVEQLPLRPGDLASPEVPVATIVASDTMRVVTCVPESHASSIEVGQEAELTSVFGSRSGTGVIESVTSEIAPLPLRCQPPGGKLMMMGRLAVVALDGEMTKLAGESQLVRLQARRRPQRPASPATTSASQPVATDPEPTAMAVPPALAARSRFEPSGLVWIPSLDRYVIVSDDTGFEEQDEHAPWLFTMGADGKLDPEPLAVGGIDKLADLESITAAPDGTLWVLSSQSLSKKGKRSAARQRLAHIALHGGHAKLLGSIEVARLLARDPAVREKLGLADTRELDIEGLASQGGALYIGLKAPLDAAGRAPIWKVGDPEKLVAGDIAAAQLASFASVALTVEADGRTVAGGIADLIFLDATTLAIAATASAIDPQAQSGALYTAHLAPGPVSATRVRTFRGLKPEGLAIAKDPTKLAITFDRGSELPLWLELPLAPVLTAEAH